MSKMGRPIPHRFAEPPLHKGAFMERSRIANAGAVETPAPANTIPPYSMNVGAAISRPPPPAATPGKASPYASMVSSVPG